MNTVGVLLARRTPHGAFQGSFAALPSTVLLASTIRSVLSESEVTLTAAVYGTILQRSILPVKQALLLAEQEYNVPNYVVNQGHNSGALAVLQALACARLERGYVLCGGFDSASQSPHVLVTDRLGNQGDFKVLDLLTQQAYQCLHNDAHAGLSIEKTNFEAQLLRDKQDEYARQCYKRHLVAEHRGFFETDVISVPNAQPEARNVILTGHKADPLYYRHGTVTSWNSAMPGDAAISLLVGPQSPASLFSVTQVVQTSVAPSEFPFAAVAAAQKLLKRVPKGSVDLWQVNDYFATIPLLFEEKMGLSSDIVNVDGGSISSGDALGASSAIHLVTLAYSLKERGLSTGVLASGDISGNGLAIAISV